MVVIAGQVTMPPFSPLPLVNPVLTDKHLAVKGAACGKRVRTVGTDEATPVWSGIVAVDKWRGAVD
jgi:hypothetical protein